MAIDIELYGNDEMVCPYCKHEGQDSWEYLQNGLEDGTAECGNCYKEFKWEATHTTTYTTAAIEEVSNA